MKSFAKSSCAQFITVGGPLGLSQQGIEKYHFGIQACKVLVEGRAGEMEFLPTSLSQQHFDLKTSRSRLGLSQSCLNA